MLGYRLRPRSAATLVTTDDEPEPGLIERLRRLARQVLSAPA